MNEQRSDRQSQQQDGQWQQVCRIGEVPRHGVRVVQRGLAWQELPGVELTRDDLDRVYAVLQNGAKRFVVGIEEGWVLLDLNELKAPASRAEARSRSGSHRGAGGRFDRGGMSRRRASCHR